MTVAARAKVTKGVACLWIWDAHNVEATVEDAVAADFKLWN